MKWMSKLIAAVFGMFLPLAALAITTAPVSVVPIVEQSVSIYDAGSFQVVFNNVLTGTVATFQSSPFFGRIAGLVAAKSVPPLRQQYINEVRALEDVGLNARTAGQTTEDTARMLQQMRRDLGVQNS